MGTQKWGPLIAACGFNYFFGVMEGALHLQSQQNEICETTNSHMAVWLMSVLVLSALKLNGWGGFGGPGG